jgi:hypothetical protein
MLSTPHSKYGSSLKTLFLSEDLMDKVKASFIRVFKKKELPERLISLVKHSSFLSS